MQVIAYNKDIVTIYHTRPSKQGTSEFECVGTVSLVKVPVDDQGRVVVACPNCPDYTTWFPLTGGTEAQRLHAYVRLADPKHPAQTLVDAIESVIADVSKSGGLPSVELGLEGLKEVDQKPDETTQPALFELASLLEAAKG